MKEASAGFVFLCSDITEAECLKRSLFGGKEKYVNRVRGLEKGHKLFLYNYNTKKLHGVFEATTGMQENIVKNAWNGEFPWQIKVKRVTENKPVSREDIGKTLKFDMMGRPSARLSVEIVNDLEKLFKSKKRIRTYADETQYFTDDGHKVRSKAEQIIDNWLYKNRISHGYEASIPNAKRCDFEIQTSDGKIYIEYWGMNDTSYIKNKKAKLEIYKKNNLKLVSLYPKDLRHIENILSKELLK